MCEGKPARTITDIGLDELFVDGLVRRAWWRSSTDGHALHAETPPSRIET
jgi:hypothetical protein